MLNITRLEPQQYKVPSKNKIPTSQTRSNPTFTALTARHLTEGHVRPAHRTRRLVAGVEPLVQALGVELLAAGLARELRQCLPGTRMYDAEADHAFLNTIEPLVDLSLPQQQRVEDASVLLAAVVKRIVEFVSALRWLLQFSNYQDYCRAT